MSCYCIHTYNSFSLWMRRTRTTRTYESASREAYLSQERGWGEMDGSEYQKNEGKMGLLDILPEMLGWMGGWGLSSARTIRGFMLSNILYKHLSKRHTFALDASFVEFPNSGEGEGGPAGYHPRHTADNPHGSVPIHQ